ncbi:MAG: SDR family oxidoreductase [Porticoccaceae bacterium]|jgi:3-oxoacyl-[acyl-carrier protein] reductase
MDLGIRGRKAIVNGGSAGLGKAGALALAREGVELVISARGEERLLSACAEIARETGVSVTPVVADHSTEEGRSAVLAACPAPDILVSTCSPPPMTPDRRTITADHWRESLDTGLLSPVWFIEATIDGMAERGWGRIVNIASGAVKYPHELRILSGAPRAALVNYSVAVSKAVAARNVTINTLLPVMHHTAGIHAVYAQAAARNGTTLEEELRKAVETMRIPAGRFGNADDFGAFVALFCSEFANYVTGQSLVIDGGVATSLL